MDHSEKIRRNPEAFLENVLGVHLWEKQLEIVRAVASSRKTVIRSCHGAGKSFSAASILLWFIFAHPRSLCVVTSASFRQLEQILWREIRTAHKHSKIKLGGKMFRTRYEIDDDWYAIGISTKEPENFAGFHSENILLIADEASGIDDAIFEAMQGILSSGNAKLLLIGNPTRSSGYFHDAFLDPDFTKIHISAFDIPNVKERRSVIPGLTEFVWTEGMARKYGIDSDVYRIRVLGEPPAANDGSFIAVSDIEAAIDSDRDEMGEKDPVLGVDPARYGDDSTDMVERRGNKALVFKSVYSQSVTDTAGEIIAWLMKHKRGRANIDSIGIGGGVYDIVKDDPKVGHRVFAVNVARAPFGDENEDAEIETKEQYAAQRDQGWAIVKEWLKTAILEKHENWYQLAKPRYKYDTRGRLKIESKDDMKKRKIPSPNTADALIVSLMPGETEEAPSAWTG